MSTTKQCSFCGACLAYNCKYNHVTIVCANPPHTQWSGTRTRSAIPAVRFNCIRAQTFNVVVYGEYTENCRLPFSHLPTESVIT